MTAAETVALRFLIGFSLSMKSGVTTLPSLAPEAVATYERSGLDDLNPTSVACTC